MSQYESQMIKLQSTGFSIKTMSFHNIFEQTIIANTTGPTSIGISAKYDSLKNVFWI